MPARNTFLICTRDTDTNDEFTTEPGQTTFLKVPAGKTTYSRAESITAERWKKAVIAAADGEEEGAGGEASEGAAGHSDGASSTPEDSVRA